MADITFVGSATGSGAGGANASINVGGISGIANGDFLVVMSAVYVRADGDGLATTNGSGSFTEPVNALTSNSTRRLRVAHKFRNGDTTVTIAGTGNASDAVSGIVLAFRNVSPTTPLDGVTPTTATGSSSNPNAPSIDTSTDLAMVIACAASPVRDTTIGNLSGFANSLYATPTSQTNNAETGAAYLSSLKTPAGTVDPAAFASWTTTNNIWVAASLVLRSDRSVNITVPQGNLALSKPPSGALSIDAIATAQAHSTNGDLTTISNPNLTIVSGNALLATVTWAGTTLGGVSGISAYWDTAGTNQALTQIGTVINNGTDTHVALFGLVNPTAGNKNFTISWTETLGVYVDLISFSGADNSSVANAFQNFNSATGTASPASLSITSATGHYTVAEFGATPAADLTTLNQTVLFGPDINDSNGSAAANYAVGAASNSHTCTLSATGVWVVCGCDVVPTVGAPETAPTISIAASGETRNPPQGSIALSPTAPTMARTANVSISTPQGNLGLSEVAPSRVTAIARNTLQGNATLSPTAPTINIINTVSQGNLSISAIAPRVVNTGIGVNIIDPNIFDYNASYVTVSAGSDYPSGESVSYNVTEDATDNLHYIISPFISRPAGSFQAIFELKYAGRQWVELATGYSGGTAIAVDLVNKVFGPSVVFNDAGLFYSRGKIIDLGSGWIRIVLTYTATANASESFSIFLEPVADLVSYQGDGSSGIIIGKLELVNIFSMSHGEKVLSSIAPTITLTSNLDITIPQGNVSLSEVAPTVQAGASVNINPASRDAALSPTAPTMVRTITTDISPARRDLGLSPTAPAIVQTITTDISPARRDLGLSPTAPTMVRTDHRDISPARRDLTLSEIAPTVQAGGNVGVGPSQGNASLSGTAPVRYQTTTFDVPSTGLIPVLGTPALTFILSSNISPSQANRVLSPTAPSVVRTDHRNISPAAKDLGLSATASTVVRTITTDISPARRDLALSPTASTLARTDHHPLSLPSQNLTLSAAAPEIQGGASIGKQPGTRDIILSPTAPTTVRTITTNISPATRDLGLSSTASTLVRTITTDISPARRDLGLSPTAPTLARTDHRWLSPPVRDLGLSEAAPEVRAGDSIGKQPGTRDASLSPTAPTAARTEHRNIAPQQGNLAFSGTAPVVAVAVARQPLAGTVILSPTAPVVVATAHRWAVPLQGNLGLSETAPSRLIDWSKSPARRDLALSSSAPTVVRPDHRNIAVPQGNVVLTKEPPVTGGNVSRLPPQGNVVVSRTAPTVARTDHHWVEPATKDLSLVSVVPIVFASVHHPINVPSQDLALSTLPAQLIPGLYEYPVRVNLLMTSSSPTIKIKKARHWRRKFSLNGSINQEIELTGTIDLPKELGAN